VHRPAPCAERGERARETSDHRRGGRHPPENARIARLCARPDVGEVHLRTVAARGRRRGTFRKRAAHALAAPVARFPEGLSRIWENGRGSGARALLDALA
jgi:hypothetical protein